MSNFRPRNMIIKNTSVVGRIASKSSIKFVQILFSYGHIIRRSVIRKPHRFSDEIPLCFNVILHEKLDTITNSVDSSSYDKSACTNVWVQGEPVINSSGQYNQIAACHFNSNPLIVGTVNYWRYIDNVHIQHTTHIVSNTYSLTSK